MIITDTTNLKVGDFLRITKQGWDDHYYYKVLSIRSKYRYRVLEIGRTEGPHIFDFKYLKDFDTVIMTEEEVSLLLLEI